MSLRIAAIGRPQTLAALREALAPLDVELRAAGDSAAFIEALGWAEAALLPIYFYDRAVADAMAASRTLRWMQLLTVGTERLRDMPPPGLQVTTAGDAMAGAIAEHAMALLLAAWRGLRPSLQGRPAAELRPTMRVLAGSRVAIVGHGAIGREFARRARAFGMHVTGLRRQSAADGIADEVRGMHELHEVLAQSDAVLVAAPLTDETRGLLDERALAACKPGAVIVNVSRGAILDNDALARLLASGHLGAAALDVTDPEPLPPGHALAALPNVILTPHVAAAGSEAAVARFAAANVRRFIAGEPLAATLTGAA